MDSLDRINPGWARNQLAEEAVAALIKGLERRQVEVRHQSSHLLTRIGRAAVPALVRALADEEKDIRQVEIARVLGRLGADAAEAGPALADRLASEHAHVRQAAAEALGQLGGPADGAVGGLIRVLADWHPGVREAAARSLGQFGPSAGAAAAGLVRALSDTVAEVSKAAMKALAQVGAAAVPPLRQALTHPNVEQRLLVAETLWHAGVPEVAVPALAELLRDQKVRTYVSSASLLYRIGQAGRGAAPVLVCEAARADWSIWLAVRDFYTRDALGPSSAQGDLSTWNGFLASLNALGLASDLRVRQAVALIVLLRIGAAAIREAAQDPDADVRQAAARVLSWTGG
jgi:HEAT repeat protein